MPFVIGVMGIGGERKGRRRRRCTFARPRPSPRARRVQGERGGGRDGRVLGRRAGRTPTADGETERETGQGLQENPKLTEAEKDEARKKAINEDFTPEELKRLKGVSNGGYHYLGAAKIIAPIGKAFADAHRDPETVEPVPPADGDGRLPARPDEKVDEKYNAGFSMYVAAWPLLKNYPGQDFQSGLFGTWMFAQFDGNEAGESATPTSRADSAGGGTRGSPPRRRSSSWAAWP